MRNRLDPEQVTSDEDEKVAMSMFDDGAKGLSRPPTLVRRQGSIQEGREGDLHVDTDPLVDKDYEDPGTPMQRTRGWVLDFANILKTFIGSNFLGMPYAFHQAGVYGGIVGILVIAWVTNHCCKLLVHCKNSLPNANEMATYGDVGTQVLGKRGKLLVDIFLVFTQTGFCIGYAIFISKNIDSFMPSAIQDLHLLSDGVSIVSIAITAACVLPLCFVKKVKQLSGFSLIADVTLVVGMAIVLYYDDCGEVYNMEGINWSGLPIFFGLVTSSFEGIGLVVPVERTMNRDKLRYPLLLDIVLCLVTLMLGSFGVLGYLTYGNDTKDVITLNLPEDDVLTYVVKACLIIAIIFTYPMQLFPVTEIFDFVFLKKASEGLFDVKGNAIRVVCCLFTVTIAFFVPFFGLISGLIGALGSSFLAFILPVVFHLVMFRKELSWWVIAKDVIILIFGSTALIVGTVFAVKDIINALI
jgi:proton-coupled amino acid transporter